MGNTPITFTITPKDDGNILAYTKDTRVMQCNKQVEFNKDMLLTMMNFITGTLNRQGFAVLFEVD